MSKRRKYNTASETKTRKQEETTPTFFEKCRRTLSASLSKTVRTLTSREFWKERWYLVLCFALPVLIMYMIYLAREIHPFGDGCVLVLDLNAQYVWFFEALRDTVWGNGEMLYTFFRALGGEFLGMYAYYLASPLSYIVCLFPKDRMLEALLTLFLLKAGISGFTFGYYMHKTEKLRRPMAIIIFSLCYALSAYAIVQQHNTMWIDALMWLPLITLGLESLVKYGRYKMYTIFLALTLFSNFYIGYMVCIYCLFYFFLYYLSFTEVSEEYIGKKKWHFLKSFVRVALYSVLAVGIAAVILLSAYYSLNFGKTTFSSPTWEWTQNFDLYDLVYKLLPGSYDTVRPDGLPFVYCGLLTLLMIPAYFLSRKIPMRQKIAYGLFTVILVASFSLSVVDLVWHGFQRPNWLNYRYSFMLTFLLCVMACRAFSVIESIPLRTIAGTGGLIGLFCIVFQKFYPTADFSDEAVEMNVYSCIWFTILMIAVYLAALAILRTSTQKQVVSVILVMIVVCEVFLCGLWNMNAEDTDVTYSKYSYYNDFLDKATPFVEEVQASDTGFYRMEKTFFRKINDNMALGIRGLSGSTSTLNTETIQFLNHMGYASSSHWSKYVGGSPVNDSLLGIKYVLSDQDNTIYKNYYDIYLEDAEKGYTAYRNPYALSIAYGVDNDILRFPMGFIELDPEDAAKEEDEEVSKMATFVSTLKARINSLLGISETVRSAEYKDESVSPYDRLNKLVTAMLGEEEEVKVYSPVAVEDEKMVNIDVNRGYVNYVKYTPKDTEKDATITYTVTMPNTNELYFYLPSDAAYAREVKVTVEPSGKAPIDKGTFNGGETTCIKSLGYYEEGTVLEVTVTLKAANLFVVPNEDIFYVIDWAVFEDAMARLGKDQLVVTEYTEKEIEGTFTASEAHELVMTTIAYDEGWQIYVDGKKAETTKLLGSVIGFYVEGTAGQTHEVRMVYRPTTFVIGMIITVISALLLCLIMLLEKFIRRVPVLSCIVSDPEGSSDQQDGASNDPIDQFLKNKK